jgi:hypothetical protein
MKKRILIVCLTLFAAGCLVSAKSKTQPLILNLLKKAGATSFAVNETPGGGLDSLYLGYNAEGNAVAAAASRQTKTYRKAITVVLVTPQAGGYKIEAAEVTEPGVFPGKARTYVQEALDDISGKTFTDRTSTRALVDGVSGATKYYKAIYVSYSLMANRAIETLENKPAWKTMPIPGD